MSELDLNRTRRLEEQLAQLDRRSWWLWWYVVFVVLLLAVALVVIADGALLLEEDAVHQTTLSASVRGLVFLSLLFSIYVIYQHLVIYRMGRQLRHQLAVTARFKQENEELVTLAALDPLTALYNRRFVEQRLAEEIARAERFGYPMTALLIDLDDFKDINDKYGHAAGDSALQQFAASLRRAIRFSDVPIRLGGDEFMVLLPDCVPHQLKGLLDRISPFVPVINGQPVAVDFSVGWVQPERGESARDLLLRVDKELYADKRRRKAMPFQDH